MATRYVIVAMTYSREIAETLLDKAKAADALIVEHVELEPGDQLVKMSHVKEALGELALKTVTH